MSMGLEEKIITFSLAFSLAAFPVMAVKNTEPKIALLNPTKVFAQIHGTEHYAQKVIYEETKNVEFAFNALGRPDGDTDPGAAYAIVHPGGEITLKMAKPFAAFKFYNSGRIVAKEGCKCSIAALVPTKYVPALAGPGEKKRQKARRSQDQGQECVRYAWREILPGLVPGGFDIPQAGQVIVDTIKIKNIGSRPVYLDAVIGYSNE